MINQLGGNEESVKAFTSCLNKTITGLRLEDDKLSFGFDDGTKLSIYDDGQSCCEHRYMRTDDRLEDFIGAKLLGAEIKSAPNLVKGESDYDQPHEIQFLE